jgi:hypothetical protein
MIKVYPILFMLILLSIFTTTKQSTSCNAIVPTKADDCKDDSLDATEKDNDKVHCCYYKEEKMPNSGRCKALTSRQYKNIGKYIKYKEEEDDYEYKISIDCQSSFLHLFLFTLVMQLILL